MDREDESDPGPAAKGAAGESVGKEDVETPATAVPDPRDRRKGERRSGADRRAGTEPPPGVERRQGDRRRDDRRTELPVPDLYRAGARHINEYPLAPDEMEFINAVNAYRTRHMRPFPTWSEVLHIVKALGYTKPAPPDPPAS
jgi:hypothetical protein